MTGFGKSAIEICQKKITIEVKSLNSKQLDMSSRLPSLYRELEGEMRNLVAKKLERGKVDLSVTVDNLAGVSATTLNVPALKAYKEQIELLARELGLPEPTDWYSVLMRLPDAVKNDSADELTDPERQALLQCLSQALDGVAAHRRAEGERLEEFFTLRVNKIKALLEEVPQFEAERVAHVRAKLEDGLSKIKDVDYDKGRLEQEMIYYIEKLDINEEKQRLAQHLNYFIETMAGTPGQGKKLGFIAQEMGREINTMGSKSNHAGMQRLVVKMKDELEQIKEQVLNVM